MAYLWTDVMLGQLYSAFHLMTYLWTDVMLGQLYSAFHLMAYLWTDAMLGQLYSAFHLIVYLWTDAMLGQLYSAFHLIVYLLNTYSLYLHKYAWQMGNANKRNGQYWLKLTIQVVGSLTYLWVALGSWLSLPVYPPATLVPPAYSDQLWYNITK